MTEMGVRHNKHQIVLLFGDMCTGKSTLGRQLADRFRARYVSFGERRREEIKLGSAFGIRLRALEQGGLEPPAHDGLALVGPFQSGEASILSGYPITPEELVLISKCSTIVACIVLTATPEAIRTRVAARKVCPSCGFSSGADEVCPKDGETMQGRSDSTPEDIARRSALFNSVILPFLKDELAMIPQLVLNTDDFGIEATARQASDWLKDSIQFRANS